MKSRILYSAVFLSVIASYAEPTVNFNGTSYEIVDNVLKITVPSGVTNEVASAELSPLLNNTVTSVEKHGRGAIVINTDILAYEGDIYVKEGTWRVVDSKGLGKLSTTALANDVGKVYVSDGATLESKCDEKPKYAGKQIHVSGYGVDGKGALLVSGSVNCDSATWGSNLVLKGDTYASSISEAWWMLNNASYPDGGYLTFNGHDFIVDGGLSANRYVILSRINTTDLGRIVLTNQAYLSLQGINNIKAVNGEKGSIIVNPDCRMRGNNWYGRMEWDVIWNTEKYLSPNPYTTVDVPVTNKCTFHGEFHVEKWLKSAVSDKGGLGFLGPLTGQGNIFIDSNANNPNTNQVWFANAESSFTGQIECRNVCLAVPVNGGLPLTSSLKMTDCSVRLSDENYVLPNAVLTNTKECIVSGGQGKWTKFEKGGPGTLIYDSAVGADMFIIGDGVVRIKVDAMRASAPKAGLVEGVDYYGNQTDAIQNVKTGKVATAYAIQSNLRAMTSNNLLDIRNPEGYDTNPDLRYSNITYSGYLWNREPENKTVTITCHVGANAYVWLDDELIIEKSHVSTISGVAIKKTIVLTPGAHRFLTTNYARTHDGGITWSATNFNWNAMGLQWDPQGRDATNKEYYVKMEDPGDGSLFTWALPEETVVHPLDPATVVQGLPEFKVLRFVGESGVLDMAGYALTVENVEGFPVIRNGGGNFTVKGKWTVDAADVLVGRKATGLSMSFGADAELVLTNPKVLRASASMQNVKWLIAESIQTIAGNLSVKDPDLSRNFKVSLEDDKMYLKYVPTGTVVIIK